MKRKICVLCSKKRALSFFQKDSAKRDGYRSACSDCSNARRRGQAAKKKARVETVLPLLVPPAPLLPQPVVIKVEEEPKREKKDVLSQLFEKVLQKYQSHFSVSICKSGKARLQIHSSPCLTYRAQSIVAVLEQATS